jgi:Mrp family chromosome partitioning ATPase/capsular polysaccharide biosynthesis protein
VPVSHEAGEQKDFRDYLRPVLKRWWLLLIVPLATIGTYLYYDHKPKSYQSSAEIYVQSSPLDQIILAKGREAPTNIENFALLIQTSAVGEKAAKLLAKEGGEDSVPSGGVEALGIEKSSFIVVTATSDSPQGAARLANAYVEAFQEMQGKQVHREAKQAAESSEEQLAEIERRRGTIHRREALEQQIQDLNLIASQPSANAGINVAEHAFPVDVAVGHDPKGNAIFAFVISLMLAIAAAYGLEYLNRRISRVEDVEEVYELPILTEIPQVDSPAPLTHGGPTLAEPLEQPFQRLRAHLDMEALERPLRTIVVASAAPGEGKSIVARNLALAYREAGRNVAVLDADFRRPSIGRLMAAREDLGLADILSGRASFGEVVQEVPARGNGNGHGGFGPGPAEAARGELAMITAGSGDVSSALSSPQMRSTLTAAADAYGTAIIDAPPLLAVGDGLPLLAEADAVIVVVRLGVSTRDSARRLLAELARVPDIHLAGVVVNGISQRAYRARSYGYDDG